MGGGQGGAPGYINYDFIDISNGFIDINNELINIDITVGAGGTESINSVSLDITGGNTGGNSKIVVGTILNIDSSGGYNDSINTTVLRGNPDYYNKGKEKLFLLSDGIQTTDGSNCEFQIQLGGVGGDIIQTQGNGSITSFNNSNGTGGGGGGGGTYTQPDSDPTYYNYLLLEQSGGEYGIIGKKKTTTGVDEVSNFDKSDNGDEDNGGKGNYGGGGGAGGEGGAGGAGGTGVVCIIVEKKHFASIIKDIESIECGRLDAFQIETTKLKTKSDYRLKTNVEDLNEIYTVDNLRPVMYNMNSSKEIGLIAHEIQEYYPFLVSGVKDGKEYQSVNYTGLIGVLIKEIKILKSVVREQSELVREQSERVREQSERVREQGNEIKLLKDRSI